MLFFPDKIHLAVTEKEKGKVSSILPGTTLKVIIRVAANFGAAENSPRPNLDDEVFVLLLLLRLLPKNLI